MDRAQGLWHAFWMLPSNPVLPWPISGEIDVLEYYRNSNGDNIVHNVHFKGPQAGYSNFIEHPLTLIMLILFLMISIHIVWNGIRQILDALLMAYKLYT